MEKTSQDSGDGGDKQILASIDDPRENLINTAVKFLQNPKVVTSPLYQKKAFLEKKGLTSEEVQIAVSRAGVIETTESSHISEQPPIDYQSGSVGINNAHPSIYAPIPSQSRWARARDLAFTTVIVAGVSYGVYYLFQRYIRPLLLGQSSQDKKMDEMDKQMSAIQKSVEEMSRTMALVQTSMQSQQAQHNINPNEAAIRDLKTDIASLKGLLLSRNQFPPAPAPSVMLPSWQRGSASSDNAQTDSGLDMASSAPAISQTDKAINGGDNVAATSAEEVSRGIKTQVSSCTTSFAPNEDEVQDSLAGQEKGSELSADSFV